MKFETFVKNFVEYMYNNRHGAGALLDKLINSENEPLIIDANVINSLQLLQEGGSEYLDLLDFETGIYDGIVISEGDKLGYTDVSKTLEYYEDVTPTGAVYALEYRKNSVTPYKFSFVRLDSDAYDIICELIDELDENGGLPDNELKTALNYFYD